jgi:phosphoribosylanthranilate isomerase
MNANKRRFDSGHGVRLKICGITNWLDAKLAVDAGADMLGFNFYGPSPRFVAVGEAKRIIHRLPRTVEAIGAFVNDSVSDIADITRVAGLHGVQLHGDESPGQVAELARRWPVMKAFRVRPGFRVAALRAYDQAWAFLLDGFSREARGGTGKTFDWGVARLAARFGRVFLAGGLTSANIAEALKTAKPYAVDVCSGVEASPGKKDAGRLLQFALCFHAANNRAGNNR